MEDKPQEALDESFVYNWGTKCILDNVGKPEEYSVI